MVLKLYGVQGSQPVRSVEWVLMMKSLPYELVQTMPGAPNGSRSPEYLKKNPSGTVPLIEEDDGFLLWESHAILAYLADKHGWNDLYPKDLKKRALINQWLHFHHQNTRMFTLTLFAPIFRRDIKFDPKVLAQQEKTLHRVADLLDKHLAEKDKKFLVGDSVTFADICLYGDVGQFEEDICGGFDFSKYVNLRQWMANMKKVEKYDQAHQVMGTIKQIFKKGNEKIAADKAKAKL